MGKEPINSSAERGRRVTIDLTPNAVRELDRIREQSGRTTADLFRFALTLLVIYVNAKSQGKEVVIMGTDPSGTREMRQVELPV